MWKTLNGNYMTYSYLLDNNCLYPQSISYGGNVRTGAKAANTISFSCSQRRDVIPFVINGVQGKMSSRLSDIVSKSGDAVYRHVILDYGQFRGMQPLRLCNVIVDDGHGNRQKPIKISWRTFPDFSPSAKKLDVGDMGDFNGDGIPDFVMFSDSKIIIAHGNGDGHFTQCPAQTIAGIDRSGFDSRLAQTVVYDFDNDGRSDLVMAKADKKTGIQSGSIPKNLRSNSRKTR